VCGWWRQQFDFDVDAFDAEDALRELFVPREECDLAAGRRPRNPYALPDGLPRRRRR
jgi:hypothetical protein